MVLLLGGVSKIVSLRPVPEVWVNYLVLTAAFLIEGTTLAIGLRASHRTKGRRGWPEALRHSQDPFVFTVLLENTAALLGICLATTGLILAHWLHAPAFDGIASILVGLLLASTASFFAVERQSLLTGEAAAPESRASVRTLPAIPPCVASTMSCQWIPASNEVLLAISLDTTTRSPPVRFETR